jgi:hypothetical protein
LSLLRIDIFKKKIMEWNTRVKKEERERRNKKKDIKDALKL